MIIPKSTFQSRMRAYMILGIFALIMTLVMGFAQKSVEKIKDDRQFNSQSRVEYVQPEDSDTIEILEMVEITPPKEHHIMIAL